MTLDELIKKYPGREASYTLQTNKPNETDLEYIRVKYTCTFPDSFVQFQLEYYDKAPMGDFAFDGFGWANKNLESYMNLEEIVKDFRESGFPDYLTPFRTDNGDYWCFDTRTPQADGETPVVIWSHNDLAIEKDSQYRWLNFVEWLDRTMEEE